MAVRKYRTQRETGNRDICCGGALGRAVIAMTAVRIRTFVEQGMVTDPPDIRPPTDVMAITSLPMPEPIIRSPVSR
jgi:hypothetical protein